LDIETRIRLEKEKRERIEEEIIQLEAQFAAWDEETGLESQNTVNKSTEKTRKPRLTKEDDAAIERLYGTKSVKYLAIEFNVDSSTIHRHITHTSSRNENIHHGRPILFYCRYDCRFR